MGAWIVRKGLGRDGSLEPNEKHHSETVQTAYGAMSYIYAATGNKFIIIIDEWDVLIRDEAGKVHECVIQNYFK